MTELYDLVAIEDRTAAMMASMRALELRMEESVDVEL
jgi:hypothetical protein